MFPVIATVTGLNMRHLKIWSAPCWNVGCCHALWYCCQAALQESEHTHFQHQCNRDLVSVPSHSSSLLWLTKAFLQTHTQANGCTRYLSHPLLGLCHISMRHLPTPNLEGKSARWVMLPYLHSEWQTDRRTDVNEIQRWGNFPDT